MAIVSQPLIPAGAPFVANSAGVALPPNFTRPSLPGGGANPHAITRATPCPGNVLNSRHTLAMDIAFDDAYLAQPFHCGIISRFKGGAYNGYGDNRGGAITLGEDQGWYRMAAIEEIEIVPNSSGVRAKAAPVIQPNRSYRMVIDTIFLNGQVGLEARLRDNTTGQLVYQTGTNWSAYPQHYDPAHQVAAFFNIISPGAAGTIHFTNMKSHWSDATEWVANP